MSKRFDRREIGETDESCEGLDQQPHESCPWCGDGGSDLPPDPSCEPYCCLACSIAAERESKEDEVFDVLPVRCYWCGGTESQTQAPYCSPECAIAAERASEEDEQC